MNAKQYALLLAIISPILSSVATIFQAEAAKLLSPFIVASFSGLIASGILLTYLITRGKLDLGKFKDLKKDLLLLTLLRGVFGVVLFAYGLSLTLGIKAIFFTKVEPYFVLFLFWFLEKGKVQKYHIILLTIHIIGAIILSTGGTFLFTLAQLGDIFIVVAMAVLALSYRYGKKLSLAAGAVQTNAISLGIGGLLLLPFALLFSPAVVWSGFSLGWEYLLIAIILFYVIGSSLWLASLKSMKTWMVSALRSVGPLVGAPFAFFFLGETLTPLQIIGAIIVLVTSSLIAKEHFRKE